MKEMREEVKNMSKHLRVGKSIGKCINKDTNKYLMTSKRNPKQRLYNSK